MMIDDLRVKLNISAEKINTLEEKLIKMIEKYG